MIDKRYGEWLVLNKAQKKRYWNCRCSCGAEVAVYDSNLKDGKTTRCQVCSIKQQKEKPPARRHGFCGKIKTSTYITWRSMRARCYYKGSTSYMYYGGRGIKVCSRWDVFENFLKDMGIRPDGKSLDRIDSNGDYEPDNCRWATRSEQMRNTRRKRA